MHDLTVITTLVGALLAALLLGWLTQRIGLSTIVGYMLAGIVVGPFTPGFVADTRLASQMAEIGVILLMFGVGLHFHPQELLRVWRLAVPGAIGQSALAGLAGWALARAFGWSHSAGAVFGMALAVASTVVLMKMLVEQDRLSERDGHVAVGWLIVEDLFTVAALVVLPAMASGGTDAGNLLPALLKALALAGTFALLVWMLGTRVLSWLMERMVRAGSHELFTLTVFVVALGVAAIAAEVFHVSVALGAFFAGLVLGQSRFGPQAAADMGPFRDVFSALFFVSVGMLFNPAFVLERPGLVLAALAIVMVVKPLAAWLIVAALRGTVRTSATVAVGLAQIGEFSFILGSLGVALGILPRQAMDTLVVVAIVSIAINPVLFRFAARLLTRRARAEEAASAAERAHQAATAPPAAVPVVMVGFRSLGRRLARRCADMGVVLRVVDTDDGEAQAGLPFERVVGDPTDPELLRAAGVAEARTLLVADLSLADKMQVCRAARQLNPRVAIISAAANDAERAWLQEFGAHFVCDALDEMSEQLARSVRASL
ncbi:cation:proton antiporter [Methylibium rhizosphaerae]|uniref:cation:proton antiporter n=1 Tax=Methylibium rhizosphaerae TaxID=2570323 RepID=UPI0015E2EB7A|nr:cation:proton antiporter [Methylibium rhizosphaerae]